MDNCPICFGTGRYRLDIDDLQDPRFGKTIACECRTQSNAQHLQDSFGSVLNKRLRLDDFKVRGDGSKEMARVGKDFIAKPVGMVTVYGSKIAEYSSSSANGNGKSTWAQAVVNECILRGVSALYVTASDLMGYINAGIKDDKFGVEARIDKLANIPLLIVDEMTQVRWTEWVEDKLSTLVNRRYARDEELGSVYVMDEDPKRVLHKRIVSRFFEGIVIRNADADMRPSVGENLNVQEAML